MLIARVAAKLPSVLVKAMSFLLVIAVQSLDVETGMFLMEQQNTIVDWMIKMKIVVNRCFGGFGLSPEAVIKLYQKDKSLFKETKIYQSTNTVRKDGLIANSYSVIDGQHQYNINDYDDVNAFRSSKALVDVVEEMGSDANGSFAKLEVVDIPDDVEWVISEYDGQETVEEKHRSW